jgi:hypothetical protein
MRQVFNRFYRLEIHSLMLVFLTQIDIPPPPHSCLLRIIMVIKKGMGGVL